MCSRLRSLSRRLVPLLVLVLILGQLAPGTPLGPLSAPAALAAGGFVGSDIGPSSRTIVTALGDVDGDGDLDLVAGNNRLPSRLYLNNGTAEPWNGATPLDVTPADNTRAVALGDVDNDGDLDLIAGNTYQPSRLYLNNGTTNPWHGIEPVDVTPADDTHAVALGDVDGDGDLDLVTGNSNTPSRLYLNNGTANPWSGVTPIAVTATVFGDFIDSIALADMNGDNRLDLLVSNSYNPTELYLNNGTPSPWSSVSPVAITPSESRESMAVGDVDGDNDRDIIVANRFDPLRLYLNNGVGTSWTSVAPLDGTAPPYISVVALADIDGDGALDLITDGSGPTYLYLNNGTSSPWIGVTPQIIIPADSPHAMSIGDVDGDSDLDLIFAKRLYQNSGLTNVWLRTTPVDITPANATQAVELGDVDGDGDLDLITGNASQPTQLYLNNGTLSPWSDAAPIDITPSNYTQALALGDVDGDNNLDLLVGNGGQPSLLYLNNGTAAPWSGVSPIDIAAAADTTAVVLGDVDGDDDLDLVAANYALESGQKSQVYLNNGTSAPWSDGAAYGFSEPDDTEAAQLGDVDGDGDLDLVVGNLIRPGRLYLNNGGPNPWAGVPAIDIPGTNSTEALALGDIDGDEALDLVAGGRPQSQLYFNNRAANPWEGVTALTIPAIDDNRSVALGDIDNDGDLDLVTGNSRQPGRLYLNSSSGGPWSTIEPFAITPADNTQSVALGDVDADGDLDLIAGNDGEPNRLYINRLHDHTRPEHSLPRIVAARPGHPDKQLVTPNIPISYTLAASEGELLHGVRAFYSLDGGGSWRPAIGATGTLTRSLAAHPERLRAPIAEPIHIPDLGTRSSTIVFPAPVNGTAGTIRDLDITLTIAHSYASDLRIELVGPDGTTITLADRAGGSGDNFINTIFDDEAARDVISGTTPFTGTYRPVMPLSAFDGKSPVGTWTLRVADMAGGDTGALVGWSMRARTTGVQHIFIWDTRASGAVGKSDNVVVRLVAIPNIRPTRNGVAGPFQYASTAATTPPFRLRGTQARVMQGDQPMAGAQVYRLPEGQIRNGQLTPPQREGHPQLFTDHLGYLQGRGPLAAGDRLVALAPISATTTYTMFLTSARPISTGLELSPLSATTVQTLSVSPSTPLLALNFDLSLEWDARADTAFLARLEADIKRASELLFRWSNGQVALGDVRVFNNRTRWDEAHIRVYATNRLRPNAVKGGIVDAERPDPNPAAESYMPGQIRMGAVWNRYGEATANLGDDWARTLAHEIGHYALFLDDNYLGQDSSGRLISVSGCRSPMADPYRDDYGSFHPESSWLAGCGETLSQKETGRSDWATIKAFYDQTGLPFTLNQPASFDAMQMPAVLPLALTRVFLDPALSEPSAPQPLDEPVLVLTGANGQLLNPLPGAGARGVLYQGGPSGERLIDLGEPNVDQLLARGARPGDLVCLYELDRQRQGCTTINASYQPLWLVSQENWQPDLRLTPVTSTTLRLEVRNLQADRPLWAQLYPSNDAARPPVELARAGADYVAELTSSADSPAFDGFVRLWVDEPAPRRETVVDFRLGGNPGGKYSHGAPRGNPGGKYSHGAPVLSGDGQAILYGVDAELAEGQFFAIQAAASPPPPPSWATPVGRAYRLTTTPGVSLAGASLNVGYLGDDVPRGQEAGLQLYFWSDSEQRWEALVTDLSTATNTTAALVSRPGIYMLMTSLPVSLPVRGWNLVYFYPGATQPVSEALGGLVDSSTGIASYTTVYSYVASDSANPWRVHDHHAPSWVNTLMELQHGGSYWIRTTEPITAPVRGGLSQSAQQAGSILASPPATYYGFAPQAPASGLTVEALINGVLCGQATTAQQTIGAAAGEAFAITVRAAGDGGEARCGTPGARVVLRFSRGGAVVAERVVAWTNEGVQQVQSGDPPGSRLFLPLTVR